MPLELASDQCRVNRVAGVRSTDGQKMVRYLGQPWRVLTGRVEAWRTFAGQTSASVHGGSIHNSLNDIIIK